MLAPLAILIAGIVLVSPIMALVALARSRRLGALQEQIDQIQRRLSRIESRLSSVVKNLEPSVEPAPRTAPAAPPTPAPPMATPPIHAGRPPMQPPMGPADFWLPEPGSAPPAPAARSAAPFASARPAPPAPPSLSVPAPPFDWERWVGIRGAAVLGAVALGLAGLLFFKYSIEHGLITPAMRVVFGTLTGLACLGVSEWLRGRGYRTTAEGLSGAGVVILYAAFWSAHVLYGLIGMTVAFGLMVLVTVTCCLLALRHASQLVAVLGLAGGFATPLLLASGADRPIGLFGYVLLLDLGLLLVARKRTWPSLALLSLLATVLMQGLWIGARMGPERLTLGLVIVGLFAALFAVAGRLASGNGRPDRTWVASQSGAFIFAFAFAVYFASRVELGAHLYPIALLLGLLGAGASWVARGQKTPLLGSGAATASVAVVGVWLMQHPLTTALAWETVAVVAGLALVFHLFVELDPEPHGADGPAPAAMVAACGSFVLLLLSAATVALPPWPWLAGWAVLSVLLYRHAAMPAREVLQVVAAVGLGIGLSILHLAHSGSPDFPRRALFLALLVTASLVLQAAALARRRPEVGAGADHAAAALPVLLLTGLAPSPFLLNLAPLPALGTALVLGVLALVAATRRREGAWVAAAVAATAFVHLVWTAERVGLRDRPDEVLAALAFEALAVIVFTLWPLLAVRRFTLGRLAWYAAALAGPVWFTPLRHLFVWRFGDACIGALPVALGALALLAADRARRSLPADKPVRMSALVWFAAVALCFVAVAIPLQLEKEWITIGWALEGLAVVALWTRLDHPGLKYFGLLLLGAATVRLVANPAILGYYPRSSLRFVNWLLYTYLVPAAALLWCAALLKPREVERARDWEGGLYDSGYAAGSIGAGLGAIALVFVWINLAIADWFATGPVLTLTFGDQPAQRLTVSIAWAIYALVLLGVGMARKVLGLRWISLAFLLVTIGKVFLYDLGALQDLYRVASLVGLALSLLLVSLLYQRFVFGTSREEAP